MEDRILKEIYQSIKKGEKVALVTLTEITGSTPRKKGSIMAVWENGKILGSIGGGEIEHQIINKAITSIRNKEDCNFQYELNEIGTLGMHCGGKAEGFIKIFSSQDKLLIVGAGHIAKELSKFSKILNFYTVVFDDRSEYANVERFHGIDEIIVGDIEEKLLNYDIDGETSIVIITRGHKYDKIALKSVISRGAKYIGMIGSVEKTTILMRDLIEEGINKEELKVYAPIGINISSQLPEEIACGIISEILLIKNNGSLQHMKEIKKCQIE